MLSPHRTVVVQRPRLLAFVDRAYVRLQIFENVFPEAVRILFKEAW